MTQRYSTLTYIPSLQERVEAIKCALGELKADLVLKNVNLMNVITGEIERNVDIAVKGRLIARVGDCSDITGPDTKIIECSGMFAVPGLLDGHVHIESSLLTPTEFCKLAIIHGVTSIFYDSHEIGNVLGVEGIREFHKACLKLPIKTFLTVPSCIPACKLGLETCGHVLAPRDIDMLLDEPNVIALGEVMDDLSILNADVDLLQEIESTYRRRYRVCGHAPKFTGKHLQAYIASGPDSDHEVTDADEAIEKIRRGMYVMVRLGTFSQDLYRIIPKLDGKYLRRVILVSDDINVIDLVEQGYLDRAVRECVKLGLDPVEAVRLCTLNTAEYYGLDWLIGCIAPGRIADIVLVDDLQSFKIRKVIVNGKIAVSDNTLLIDVPRHEFPRSFYMTVKMPNIRPEDFEIRVDIQDGVAFTHIMKFIPGTVLTKLETREVNIKDGKLVLEEDLLYIAVIERYGKSGTRAIALASGFMLKTGAIAVSICHDSHNIVVIGKSPEDMYVAVREVEKCGGGMVLAVDRTVRACVKLSLAGLISDEPYETVYSNVKKLLEEWSKVGGTGNICDLAPLFLTALVVIPEVRLTDRGLVHVEKGTFIPVVIEVKRR